MKITALSSSDSGFSIELFENADFVAIHGNCTVRPETLGLDRLRSQVHGATSCLGAMTASGVTEAVSFFAIEDPSGAFGTSMEAFGDKPKDAARAATLAALQAADRIGEAPELILVASTPGFEEAVLEGIESVSGPSVPIIGGSAADNSVSGEWFVFDQARQIESGVIVTVMFPSRPVSFAYHNGYAPSSRSGTVTRLSGRSILEIDNRPALDVYREWTEASVTAAPGMGECQSILSDSTLWPLGRKMSELDGVSSYLLTHPAVAHGDGSIDLFATVQEGEVLTQMTGTESGLVNRAGRVATLARAAGRMEHEPIAGALMVYCGGCMLSVRDRLDDVVNGVSSALGGAPFLGTFTFGEQGQIVGAGNRHGNLMISCIVFS
ncbi:MAG: FIST N-terminal domain-containing protein [Pseudomonadota bacterium]